jgi:T5SS/PEP-CTERM-associated repeat protein
MKQRIHRYQYKADSALAVFRLLIAPALLVSVFLLSAPFDARSATETWNPAGGGGNGTWDTVTDNWNPGQTIWTNGNDALFSGTGGTVTVVSPSANSLTFSASGPYTLQGGTLALGGPGIVVNSNATISSTITSGDGLEITGSSVLTLTGSTNLQGGWPLEIDASGVVINGGGAIYGTGAIYISDTATAVSTVTVSGIGTSWRGYIMDLGEYGNGTLNVLNGATVNDYGGAYVGSNAGSIGTLTVSGSGSTWTGDSLILGGYYNNGTGNLLITNGGAVYDPSGSVGNYNRSECTATVSGTGSVWQNSVALSIGPGTLLISDGGQVFSNSYGDISGTNTSVTVTGNSSTWTSGTNLYIGDSEGGGSLQIANGGMVSDSKGYLGYSGIYATSVTVSGTGSSWINGALYVGYYGAGALGICNGGTVSASNGFGYIGYESYSNGSVTVSGSGTAWSNNTLYVGVSGSGALSIASGAAVSNGTGYIAYNAGSTGMAVASGGGSTWTNGPLYVGYSGNGGLQVLGGGNVSDTTAYIGYNAGSSGVAAISGSGAVWASTSLYIGYSGVGALQIGNSGTVSVSDGFGNIGYNPGSNGAVTVSGSGAVWTITTLGVGQYGTGSLTINSGGTVYDAYGLIGKGAGSKGVATVSGTGSLWSSASGVYVGGNSNGPAGVGILNIFGGGTVTAPQTTVWDTGTLELGGSTPLVGALNVDGGTVLLNDGTTHTVTLSSSVVLSPNSTLGFAIGNGCDEIALSGSGSITVTGLAALNLYPITGQVVSGTDVLFAESPPANLSFNVYNGGNFTYSLLNTSTSQSVVIQQAAPLTTAYWKGGQNNIWAIIVGGTGTNWTTDEAGANQTPLTPSATTDVYFSASTPAAEGSTVLDTDMTVKSLTVNDPNSVMISGSDSDPLLPNNDTLTISGSTGTIGINVNSGAGPVTIGANVYLSGNSQMVAVNNTVGVLISGTVGSSNDLGPVNTN